MVMQKSTQPQGLVSLKKSTKIPQKSSKTLTFDYESVENQADTESKKTEFQSVVNRVADRI